MGMSALVVYLCAAYVLWVLFGVIAWVGHMGDDCRDLGLSLASILPGHGSPSTRPPAETIADFVAHNLPLATMFIAQHSLLSIERLGHLAHGCGFRPPRGGAPRLVFNVLSAVTLHLFMHYFVPYRSDVVFSLPFGPAVHFGIGTICLTFAVVCVCANPTTWALLGVSQTLGWTHRCPRSMDAITHVGMVVWRMGGVGAFVVFTGLSIIPRKCSPSDVVVRVAAALYLRLRSRHFRMWVKKIESAHLLTWVLRGGLVVHFCIHTNTINIFSLAVGCAAITLLLRVCEV
jgi:hypothetical protein